MEGGKRRKKVISAELLDPYDDGRFGLMVIRLGADHFVYRRRPGGFEEKDLPRVGQYVDVDSL